MEHGIWNMEQIVDSDGARSFCLVLLPTNTAGANGAVKGRYDVLGSSAR